MTMNKNNSFSLGLRAFLFADETNFTLEQGGMWLASSLKPVRSSLSTTILGKFSGLLVIFSEIWVKMVQKQAILASFR